MLLCITDLLMNTKSKLLFRNWFLRLLVFNYFLNNFDMTKLFPIVSKRSTILDNLIIRNYYAYQ